jgi:hypothetical protein
MIDQPPPQDNGTASSHEVLVASTLNAFDARLKQLEKPETKTR